LFILPQQLRVDDFYIRKLALGHFQHRSQKGNGDFLVLFITKESTFLKTTPSLS